MEVTFYKTKLTRQNRCYGATEYDNYLNGCTKKVITLSHDIVPNNPFYLETDEGMWSYNYITYTYKGYLFGAFIDGIRIQALSSSTQIIHATDSWYFALKNVGIDNIDFHGQCARAHVNDISAKGSSYYATLEYTTNTPEEVFNTSNLIYYKYEPPFNWTDDNDIYWLYIYVANPAAITGNKLNYAQSIRYGFGNRQDIDNIGITFCYPCRYEYSGFISGAYTLNVYSYSAGNIKKAELKDFTQGYITSMLVTKIPPRDGLSGFSSDNMFPQTYINQIISFEFTEEADFPVFGNYVKIWTPVDFDLSSLDFDNVMFKDSVVQHITDYASFVRYGMQKIKTSVYNPIYVRNNFLNSLSVEKYGSFYISLTFDLGQTVISVPSDNYRGLQSIFLSNNMLVFAPNSVNDYWTRLNALQTSLAGRITENNGAIQGVKQIGKTINQVLGLGENVAGIATSAMQGNKGIGGVVRNTFSFLENAVTLGTDASVYGIQRENYVNQERIGQNQQKIADYQYGSGTTTNGAVSYFGIVTCDESALISGVLNTQNYEQIGINLHRYGYNTFLQLDDIYFNHKRTNFNYFLCSECEVTGVPTDIAEDIQNMFQSGVHLWSGEVENFEVVNYQEGLTW